MSDVPDDLFGIAVGEDNSVRILTPAVTVTIQFEPDALRRIAADFLRAADRLEGAARDLVDAAFERASGRLN